jgi:AraC family transcriptional regulator
VKKELELGCPSGRLYLEGLGLAIASRLLAQHSSIAKHSHPEEGLSDRRLKQVLSYIEENLSEDLSLEQIAAVVRISPSHLKSVFRKSLGIPVHQYVVQRRVELAKNMLMRDELSLAEIAVASGFSHQSHLARHMRRILGATPSAMKRLLSKGADDVDYLV